MDRKKEIAEAMERAVRTPVSAREIPAYRPTLPEYAHIRAVTYDGMPYRGQKTKVFAYVGFPAGASPESPVPAIVLVHGGGGHPLLPWVKLWNDCGYAAIAMDTTGFFPNIPAKRKQFTVTSPVIPCGQSSGTIFHPSFVLFPGLFWRSQEEKSPIQRSFIIFETFQSVVFTTVECCPAGTKI